MAIYHHTSSFIIFTIDFLPKKCSWLPLVTRTHICVLMLLDSDRLLNIIYPEICKIYFRPITGSYLLLHKEWTTLIWRTNFYASMINHSYWVIASNLKTSVPWSRSPVFTFGNTCLCPVTSVIHHTALPNAAKR